MEQQSDNAHVLTSLFVSHGAPNVILHESAARDAMQALQKRMPPAGQPILVVSAHYEENQTRVVADPAPEMIYDFGGFEPELRQVNYPANGAPDLAQSVFASLQGAGFDVVLEPARGFDHGVWVPLVLMAPEARNPILMVSINMNEDADYHFRLGQSLRAAVGPDTLIVGSGSMTHNLSEVFGSGGLAPRDKPVPEWVSSFSAWVVQNAESGHTDQLLDWKRQAPHASRNHPTDEHFLPFFVAMGAAMEGESLPKAEHLHDSAQYGVLQMDILGW